MNHHTPLIAILSIGFVLAFAFGALATRFRVPPLVGYLLAGVVVGPRTPGFVADGALASELSEIGVILLMFGVGLHFSLKDLLAVKNIAVPGALAQITAATLLGMALAWWLGWPVGAGVVFGLSLSVASTVVLLRQLEERQILDTKRGRIAVGWLIVEDLITVVALVLLPAIAGLLGGKAPVNAGPLWLTLVITFAKVAAFVAVMLVGGARVVPWLLARVAGTGSRELFTLAVLALAMGIAFGSATLFGVSFALGAFFAGMVLNGTEQSHKAADDSLPLRDAFSVLFFVSVGMLFNPMVIVERPFAVLATLAVITLGKSVAAVVIVRAFGHPTSTAFTIAASLAQIGEFSFILAGLGMSLGLLPELGRDLVLAGAILSILMNPLIFTAIGRLEVLVAKHGGEQPEARGHAIVVGYGRVGRVVSQRLRAANVPLVIVEDDLPRVNELREQGFTAVFGNAASTEVMDAAGIDHARWLLVAVPNGLEAGEIVRHAKDANPSVQVLARAHTDEQVEHLGKHGADLVIMGEREIANRMLSRVGVNDVAH